MIATSAAITRAEYIRRLVDAAPPLTEEQRAALRMLFRGARASARRGAA